MTSAVKRSYPFGSRPSSLVEDTNQFKVPQAPLHKKMSMAPPSINVSVDGSTSWKLSNRTATFTKQDNQNNLTIAASNDTINQNGSTVRSSISAPSSPQLPPNSTTHTHNRRPSTPICVYQNKGPLNSNVADPMVLISKTENAIGDDLPYKDEPIQILPNLYLGSEINAANRSMLNRLNIEFILNVGKEVENPYLEEITNANSSYFADSFHQISPGLQTNSSVSSEDSFSTAIQSPLNFSMQLDSPIVPPSPFGALRSNSSLQKRVSARSNSLQLAHGAMLSGIPLVVPATSDFKPLKYKKFFWTHNQENLIADFIPAFAFIDEARSAGRNILVHCQCGVSRSASLIISYVMKVNRMTLNQAYEYVKDKSPYISPNMSLVYQLVEFEKTLKLGNNNNNNVLPSSPTHGKGDLKRTHSRSSSIESELLLISHRRSNSLSRGNLNSNNSNNSNDSPPKTPLFAPEGLLTIPQQQQQQQQTTVKGGTGRFHVITASIAPVSPSSLSPASSVSPTSTGSPTTPSSETSSPTTSSRRISRPPPLSSKKSNSSLTTSKNSSRSSYSSADRTPLSPKEVINAQMSPKVVSNSKTAITNTNNSSTSNDADPFVSFSNFGNNFDSSKSSNISFHSYDKTRIVNQRSHEVLSGPNSGIFSKSTLDSIFSPTRVSPPVTPVAIPDLFTDDE
ncbi:unnamed protein product [Rhizophagus irregularis]|uniref:protein-tyrosine-phosphatase n=1 Tax=Rhizophagus irregularis TaxID=588596 RepID=A0A915ZJM2_9GLOM|nr:unnamed protein product [Rhizophagus irregularis]CAB4437061.1 unnamed protein product [Rhizophagus irregularis]CAB4489901.1 unnamed protein product [Rhizophagus irregularis]CAB5195644.1 unnamed protein product [Rhizophagus irregularis]CAB5358790.1 unnamed protein product [Rhizophagus irregularis]